MVKFWVARLCTGRLPSALAADGLFIKYWNIDVRIEDDILVTETGYKLMSFGVPRDINEIEKLMKGK